MMKVIAIGNRLMSDDGIAVIVAEKLKNRLQSAGFAVIIGETDYEYCCDQLCPDDFILILDAMQSQNAPGSIGVIPLAQAAPQTAGFAQHHMNLVSYLHQCQKAYAGYLIGIEAACVEFGDALSPALVEKLPQICGNVYKIIMQLCMRW